MIMSITSMWNLVVISIRRLLVFQWVLIVANCVPLVADLFLYSYEADFVQHLHI